jgi:hypothetical protein
MTERTPEDRLREEYFDLLPEIRRVAEHLEAEGTAYCLYRGIFIGSSKSL